MAWTRSCCRLVAKGLTTGEVSAHFEEIYGASLSEDTISRITDRVLTEMTEWMARPLENVTPLAVGQTCVIHLIRNTFKYASKRCWGRSPPARPQTDPPRPDA